MRRRGPDGTPAKTITFQGIKVAIDRPRGTAVEIVLSDGTTKTLAYTEDYGFFPGVPGPDDGSLDAYVGSDAEAGIAFVVNQLRADSGEHDELKVMLGYTLSWMARDAYLRHVAPQMLGGIGALSVASLRAQLDAQRGQERPAYIAVETLLEGAMPTAPPNGGSDITNASRTPSITDPAPPNSRAPVHDTSTPMKNHHDQIRFLALARSLALITLAAGGVDDDTRATLEPLTRGDAGAPRGRDPADGQNALHVRTANVRAVREEAREVDYVASSEAVDSYGEVLRQNWILDRYLRNPVILWAHNSDWAVPTLPIGRATTVRVEEKKLRIPVKFSEKNPFARIVFDMIVEGMLRAGSVGFRPHKVTRETIDGVERVVCDQNELYEFSICPIGSNPDALVEAEERMAKMIEERSRNAVHSLPMSLARSPRHTLNTNPAAAGKRDTNAMNIKKLTDAEHDDLRRRGMVTHRCDGCSGVTLIEMPGITKMAEEAKELVAKAGAAEERAKAADVARAEAEQRIKAADERAKALDTEKTKAFEERDVAKKLAADEKQRADKAIAEKAIIELAPLTGLETWQLSPAAAKRLAARAATDPTGYAEDVAEVHAKGVTSGALKSSHVVRVTETSATDPTPVISELDANAGDDKELFGAIEKRAKEYTLLSAANAT